MNGLELRHWGGWETTFATHSLDARHIGAFECRVQVDMIWRTKKLWLSECSLLLRLSSVNHIRMYL
jgi:hypothetical protein